MKIGPVTARLRAQVAALSNRVYGVREAAEAFDSNDTVVPAAYVVPLPDEPGENTTAGAVTQMMEEGIAVIVGIDVSTQDGDTDALDQLDDLKVAILAALLGWEPAAGYAGFVYRGDALLPASSSARLYWQYDFGADRAIQQA